MTDTGFLMPTGSRVSWVIRENKLQYSLAVRARRAKSSLRSYHVHWKDDCLAPDKLGLPLQVPANLKLPFFMYNYGLPSASHAL